MKVRITLWAHNVNCTAVRTTVATTITNAQRARCCDNMHEFANKIHENI